MLNETYTLENGVKIPKLGYGTWMIEDDKAADAVKKAIALGYRHIDTAQAYANERGVGEGVRNCGVDRSEIFVTTKLDAEIKSYEEAKAAIDGSLDLMGLDYIDLIIIHSPKPWEDFHGEDDYAEGNLAAWKALEEAYEAGKLKAIGVSNFEKADLDNLIENGTVKPMVNQILAHISNTPFDLIDYCQDKGIVVEAYSPMGHGELMKNEAVAKMAERYGVSVPQLAIRYCLQLGLVPLPKTQTPSHMESNGAVDFVISDGDMETLKSAEKIKDYGEFSIFPVYRTTA